MKRLRALRAIAGLLLLVAGADTLACRCAQRPLSDYFADADLVFFGEALSAHELKDAVMPTRALLFAPLGEPYRWRTGTPVQSGVEILTPSSSATCGLQIDVGAIYVLFAWRDGDGAHHTDTCRGTRLAREHGEAGDDLFIDVPRSHLVAQLTALQGLDVLREAGANATQRGGQRSHRAAGPRVARRR